MTCAYNTILYRIISIEFDTHISFCYTAGAMEPKANEPYRHTVDEAIKNHLNQLQATIYHSMRHNVEDMANFLSERIKYYCQAEDPLHIGFTQLSMHTNSIATEVLCMWWSTKKEKLPIQWQDDPEQFRIALQVAIKSDKDPLEKRYKSIDPETKFPVTDAQEKSWINGRITQLEEFRYNLMEKAKPSPQKEIK